MERRRAQVRAEMLATAWSDLNRLTAAAGHLPQLKALSEKMMRQLFGILNSMSEWFTTFFDVVANDFWEAAVSSEVTDAEVEYLQSVLDLRAGATVLDVPCGRGRHALAMSRAGFGVTAVDISEDAVERLGRDARAQRLDIDVRRGDMRELDIPSVDGAYSMGNSVGYFGADGIRRYLGGVARSLRSGARFVVDTHMVAEAILPHFEAEGTYEAGGIRMTDQSRYDPWQSRMDQTVTFEREGVHETREMSHWVLTSGELVRLLHQAGFTVEALHSDTDRSPFTLGSSRLLAVASRG